MLVFLFLVRVWRSGTLCPAIVRQREGAWIGGEGGVDVVGFAGSFVALGILTLYYSNLSHDSPAVTPSNLVGLRPT